MRTVYDMGMGIIILGVGLVLFFGKKMGIQKIEEMDPLMRNLFGGLCVIYGGFRLYRGIKKDY
ncbi:MAG: hypothetical protein JWN76_2260 [Chitinophagaceae bacterium]|nr:hypothetical protein [Chitinophagaceae bacterium]